MDRWLKKDVDLESCELNICVDPYKCLMGKHKNHLTVVGLIQLQMKHGVQCFYYIIIY